MLRVYMLAVLAKRLSVAACLPPPPGSRRCLPRRRYCCMPTSPSAPAAHVRPARPKRWPELTNQKHGSAAWMIEQRVSARTSLGAAEWAARARVSIAHAPSCTRALRPAESLGAARRSDSAAAEAKELFGG